MSKIPLEYSSPERPKPVTVSLITFFGTASLVVFCLIVAMGLVCFALETDTIITGAAFVLGIALSGAGTLLGLVSAVFGNRNLGRALLGLILNGVLLVLALRLLIGG